MNRHEQIITDLSRKCADDVSAAVQRSAQLLIQPQDMMAVALSATASALGLTSGFLSEVCKRGGGEFTPDEIVDALWEMLRPMTLKTVGGSDADLRAFYARLNAGSATTEKEG